MSARVVTGGYDRHIRLRLRFVRQRQWAVGADSGAPGERDCESFGKVRSNLGVLGTLGLIATRTPAKSSMGSSAKAPSPTKRSYSRRRRGRSESSRRGQGGSTRAA